ncbi:MAG: hypothetical protein NZ480_07885 [Bdellovibrionaceae bacterium]|nr:hypothetical protein [Pseudobdellovibrionaceae bacterium]
MKNSFRILELSLGKSQWDYVYDFKWNSLEFEVHRIGTNFDLELLKLLITKSRHQVDAIALTGFPPPISFEKKSWMHPSLRSTLSIPVGVPICDGFMLRDLVSLWAFKKLLKTIKTKHEIFFFPLGLNNLILLQHLNNHKEIMTWVGDLYHSTSLPVLFNNQSNLFNKLIYKTLLILGYFYSNSSLLPYRESLLKQSLRFSIQPQLQDVTSVVADLGYLNIFKDSSFLLKNKKVFTFSRHPGLEAAIINHGVNKIHFLLPDQFANMTYFNYSVLDAVLRLTLDKPNGLSPEEASDYFQIDTETLEDYLKLSFSQRSTRLTQANRILRKVLSKQTKKPDFAFVVHAMNLRDYARAPGLGILNYMPSAILPYVEKLGSLAPGIYMGSISGIVSQHTGEETTGLVYALLSTPRVLKKSDPNWIYQKILGIAEDAAQRGAQIIGLGAYTKAAAEAELSLRQKCPIPITTGNSLSVSATLWSLHEAIKKLNTLQPNPHSKKVIGTAMVVGATGSIGKAAAKLLSLVFTDLVIVAPNINKLEMVKNEILSFNPKVNIMISTDNNQFISHADAIITATSSYDGNIIDIKKVKPGAVICDCSRPLVISEEQAKQRKDVLVILSGEVKLPGKVMMPKSLPLPHGVVWACLAETAILAMEKRFEPFSIGRDLEWTKVKEIYKMALKHGIRLGAIRGHFGEVTDLEFQAIRDSVLAAKLSLNYNLKENAHNN